MKFKTSAASGAKVEPLEAKTLEEFLAWVAAQEHEVVVGNLSGEWYVIVYDDYME